MIKKFNIHNIIVEKVGINLDLVNLSEELYNLIKNDKKSFYKFDHKQFNTSTLHINSISIIINKSNSSFNLSTSKITEKGFDININLNENEIDNKVIHHELNHALKFYMIGKEKSIEKSHLLKGHNLSRNFIKNPEIDEFITLYYYSQPDEIDSNISEAYYELLEKFKEINKITEKQFNIYFQLFYKEVFIYNISISLKNYNFKKLKKLNSDNLVIFFNILNDKKEILKVSRSRNKFINTLIGIKNVINDIYLKNSYYNNIDKKVKIDDLSEILKKYEIRFLKSHNRIIEKLPKLYSIILDELKKENKIL